MGPAVAPEAAAFTRATVTGPEAALAGATVTGPEAAPVAAGGVTTVAELAPGTGSAAICAEAAAVTAGRFAAIATSVPAVTAVVIAEALFAVLRSCVHRVHPSEYHCKKCSRKQSRGHPTGGGPPLDPITAGC